MLVGWVGVARDHVVPAPRRQQVVSAVVDGDVDGALLQTVEDVTVEGPVLLPGRGHHVGHHLDALDAGHVVLRHGPQGDAAPEGDDENLPRVLVQQQGQVAEQPEDLERSVVGGHLAAPVEPHLAVSGLGCHRDHPLAALAVEHQLGPRLARLHDPAQDVSRRQGQSGDGEGQGPGGHRLVAPERAVALVQPQHHETGTHVDEAQDLEGPFRAEGGNEGEARGGRSRDGAQAVDRVGIADAAAEPPEGGGVDAAHHREEGAHEQGGPEHDGEGDGEEAKAVAPPGVRPQDPAAPLRPPREEGDRADAHQADEDLHRPEEGGQVPLGPQIAAAGEAAQGDAQEEGDEDDAELVVGVDAEGDDEEAQPGDLVAEGGEAGEAEGNDDGGDEEARDRLRGRRHRGSDLRISGRLEAGAGRPVRRGRPPASCRSSMARGGDGEVGGGHHPDAALQPEGFHEEEA